MVFRVVDTIEDSSIKLSMKQKIFDKFLNILNQECYNQKLVDEARKLMLKELTYTYEKEKLRIRTCFTCLVLKELLAHIYLIVDAISAKVRRNIDDII